MSPALRPIAVVLQAVGLLVLAACGAPPDESASLEPRSLAGLWAFQPGDDQAWAAPEFDDRAWMRLRVPGSWRRQGYNALAGIAWYRLRVQAPWPSEEPLGLTLGRVDSAYELYVGGRRLGGTGALPPNPRIEYDRRRTYFIPPETRAPDGSVVVALRVWRTPQMSSMTAGPVEGTFQIGPLSALIEREKRTEVLQLAVLFLFLVIGIYHLTAGGRIGAGAEYTWFGVLALLGAVCGFLRTQSRYGLVDDFIVLKKIEHLVLWVLPAAFLQFLWIFFRQPLPRWLRVVQVILAAVALVIPMMPGLVVPLALVPVLQLAVVPLLVISIALIVRRLGAGDREAHLLGIGVVLLAVAVVHDVVVDRYALATPRLAIYGFAALVASMTATLGKRFQTALRDRDILTQEFESRISVRTRELSNAYRQMEELALWDGLTQILSRRAIRDRAESELARARRYRTPFALAIIDIDHFKTINDTHGHAVGDRVLVEITKRLVQAVRASDDVGRWGGDEFVVLMPATDSREAAMVGERLRSLVAARGVTIGTGTAQTITVSVGIAAVGETGAESLDLEALVRHADEALYRAKASGRNAVIVGEASTPLPTMASGEGQS